MLQTLPLKFLTSLSDLKASRSRSRLSSLCGIIPALFVSLPSDLSLLLNNTIVLRISTSGNLTYQVSRVENSFQNRVKFRIHIINKSRINWNKCNNLSNSQDHHRPPKDRSAINLLPKTTEA